jgi:hypothetical protein
MRFGLVLEGSRGSWLAADMDGLRVVDRESVDIVNYHV